MAKLQKRRRAWRVIETGLGRAFGGRRWWMLELAACVLLAFRIFASVVKDALETLAASEMQAPHNMHMSVMPARHFRGRPH